MIKDEEAVWKEGLYTTYGKWMDGWESRRRRTAGHDWCIVQLGLPGVIKAIEVDTAYFTGNFSPKVSVLGASLSSSTEISSLLQLRDETKASRPDDGTMGTCASEKEWNLVNQLHSNTWSELVALTPLAAGYEETRRTVFVINSNEVTTHLRINMGPDGGIARVRVYGYVSVNPENLSHGEDIDLVSVENGGLAIAWSNMHYGHPRNLIVPGRGTCMGDGWETARQPKRPPVYTQGPDGLIVLPGFDWAILKLGIAGIVSSVEVDTNFYKGNYPESCLVILLYCAVVVQ
jgi:allantoicase